MGFVYQMLPENHQRKTRSGFATKAWVVVKRAAKQVIGLYVGCRRWLAQRNGKKVTWAGLWVRVKKVVGLRPGRAHERPATYDSKSYARNFDDGLWKEDEEFWRSGSFAYRFGHSAKFVS